MKKLVFLHIPKTAGQSVHSAIERAFGAETVAPIRENFQWYKYSISEINIFNALSGHLDWAMTDVFMGPKITFTILRDPQERIASFYLFLRKKGLELSTDEIEKPWNRGLRAAKELDINDFFSPTENPIWDFILNHFDNFYTYYFCGRTYRSRAEIISAIDSGNSSSSEIMRIALENMKHLDYIGSMDKLDLLEAHLSANLRRSIKFSEIRINANEELENSGRHKKLLEMGLSQSSQNKIDEWCIKDVELIHKLRENSMLLS